MNKELKKRNNTEVTTITTIKKAKTSHRNKKIMTVGTKLTNDLNSILLELNYYYINQKITFLIYFIT